MTARDAIRYRRWDQLAAPIGDCVIADAKDASGMTLLHTAAERDKSRAARMLLAGGPVEG